MKIFVVPRNYIEKRYDQNPDFVHSKYIISIFSTGDASPLPERFNILQLQFDDITEKPEDERAAEKFDLIFFNEDHAKKIHEFFDYIKDHQNKPLFVHCDAGVSRSGAVGYMANEYFNKFLELNRHDVEYFQIYNKHIMPNPLVVRLLKNELFGNDYRGVFVNDYEYNEDGERIDIVKEI